MTEQALVKTEHGIDSLEKMGKYIAESGLFGVKNPTQAVALMLIAQAEGRHPASAAQDYHIIQGRPSLKSDTMLARFQGSGGKVEWVTYTDTKVAGKFSHPSGGTVTVDWDMDRAKKAGLGAKDSWKNYPRAMLRARVISEAIRTVYPAVLGGMYTPEEVMDLDPEMPASTEVPTPKPDTDALFDAMVAKKGVGTATSPLLDAFIDDTAANSGKTLIAVKKQALSHQDRFWTAFATWMKDQGNGDDEERSMMAEDMELDGI